MKKSIRSLLVLGASAFALMGCVTGGDTSSTLPSSEDASSSKVDSSSAWSSSASSSDIQKETLTITYEGELVVGGDITLIVKNSKGEEVKGLPISVTKGEENVSVLLYYVTLVKAGDVTLEINTDEYYGTLSFTIEEATETVVSIKQMKTMLSSFENEMVVTEGIVTASLGNSFYIGDGQEGLYVYNVSPNYTDSDAFESGAIPLGTKIRVKGKLTNDDFGLQLSGFANGNFLTDAYAKKAPDAEVEAPIATKIETEEDLKALMATPSRAGERITITGEYLKGDTSPLFDDKNATIYLKIDNTEFALKADKYDLFRSNVEDMWKKANVEMGDILTIDSVFTYYKKNQITVSFAGQGASINNDSKDATKLRLNLSSKTLQKGKTMKLEALVPEGVTDSVTYEIVKGAEFASIEGDVLTAKAIGEVKVVAKAGSLMSYPLTLQIIEGKRQTVADALSLEKGANVSFVANITAISNSGFIVSDETGSIYVYDGRSAIYDEAEFSGKIGTTVEIEGTIDVYAKNGQKQVGNYKMKESKEKLEYTPNYVGTSLDSLKNADLTKLIPVHITATGSQDDNGNIILSADGFTDAVFFVLDPTMWQSTQFGMGEAAVEADGFIAGSTTYNGQLEYYFYFSQPMLMGF